METVFCMTSAVTRGDRGPAAIGVRATTADGHEVFIAAAAIGNGTSTYAAYHAVMVGLERLVERYGDTLQTMAVVVQLSDVLVQRQLTAVAPVTDPGLVPLFMAIHNVRVESVPHVTFVLVAATDTTAVTTLAMAALDGR